MIMNDNHQKTNIIKTLEHGCKKFANPIGNWCHSRCCL